MNASQKSAERQFAKDFSQIFDRANRTAQQLVLRHIRRNDGYLRELLASSLQYQTTSEYPFVFQYSFCRGRQDLGKVMKIAASVHLLQSSTFITDDIFDFADVRYHQPAVHCQYDVSQAIIAAELFQTIAMECISAELQRPGFHNQMLVLELFHRILKDLYIGQHLDIFHTANLRMTTKEYRRVIELGAGFFFQNLARCGALLAGKPEAQVEALAAYGYHYGMGAFIYDDIADIAMDEHQTGKPFAPDLTARRMRLPVLFALQLGAMDDVRWLKKFLKGSDNSKAVLVEATNRIRRTGALHACQAVANSYFTRAIRRLASIQGSPAALAFTRLPQHLIKPVEPGVPDLTVRIAREFNSPI